MIIEDLGKRYYLKVFKSEEYKLHHINEEHEYDLEFHLRKDKESFVSLYDKNTFYVFLYHRFRLIKKLRQMKFYEVEAYKESVFHVPTSKIETLIEILGIVKIRSFTEEQKQKQRAWMLSIKKPQSDSKLNLQKTIETDKKGIIIPDESDKMQNTLSK